MRQKLTARPARTATILLIFGASFIPAQRTNDYLYPIREGRKFGFINRAGAIIVPPTYDAVGDPKEGRIRVTVGSLSGYIDYSGKVVVDPKYDSAGEFRDSRAVVRQGDKYALIDPAGKLIADIPYRVLGEFHQGLLRFQAVGRVDASGKRLPTTYGFVDRDGKVVIQPQFMPAAEFSDDPTNLPFGGLDHDWCYFDRTGKIVIRISMGPNLNGANPFVNGRLRVKEGFTWGYKDDSGNWAIPPKFNDAEDFKGGVARVQDGAKWVAINMFGKDVPENRKKLLALEPVSDGLTLVRENDLLGWMDARDRLAFPLRKYDEAHSFSCGLARFKLDDLYGFLDKAGNPAIPNQYLAAADFDHDLAFVQTREGIAYIDTKGAVVWRSQATRR
ncbi:MAG TPA: WG repeat-containing protein [Bryobacteraceae bacterium]